MATLDSTYSEKSIGKNDWCRYNLFERDNDKNVWPSKSDATRRAPLSVYGEKGSMDDWLSVLDSI